MRTLVLAAAVAAAGQGCGQAALVRDGRPMGGIVISASPAPDEKLAAQELQDYVRKISGATLPVGSVVTPGLETQVRVGVFGAAPVADWAGEKPPPDGFALETRGGTLYVVGGDARGALYGVYDLLETDLGVRWFMPADMGEDVPSAETIPLPQATRSSAPAFPAVRGLIWAGGPGAAAWEKRIRAQVGPTGAFFGHNWSNILPPTAANKQANPEWFALSQGRRSNQLCSAHPDVVRITVEKAREFFARNPTAPLFSISPNDGYDFCEDDRCQAVDRLYGVTDGSLTDRFVHYGNQVLEELGRTHPDKQVGILAYVQHTRPPVSAKPHRNYVTLITHTPWEFCHVHSLDDPVCEHNRRLVEYVRGWSQVARHVGVYEYYGHFYVFAPWPIVHSIKRDIPFLHGLGIDRFTSETQQNWANQGINFYVAAKLLWNPRLDVDALLTEYYSRFYGKAAAPMKQYWERWEQAMVATAPGGHGGYSWLRMFTPELVEECGSYLAQAETAAATDTDKVKARVAFARAGYRFTEAWTRMRHHGYRGEWDRAVAAGEEAISRIRETQGMEPQAFFVQLAVDQTNAMVRAYREGRAPAP